MYSFFLRNWHSFLKVLRRYSLFTCYFLIKYQSCISSRWYVWVYFVFMIRETLFEFVWYHTHICMLEIKTIKNVMKPYCMKYSTFDTLYHFQLFFGYSQEPKNVKTQAGIKTEIPDWTQHLHQVFFDTCTTKICNQKVRITAEAVAENLLKAKCAQTKGIVCLLNNLQSFKTNYQYNCLVTTKNIVYILFIISSRAKIQG